VAVVGIGHPPFGSNGHPVLPHGTPRSHMRAPRPMVAIRAETLDQFAQVVYGRLLPPSNFGFLFLPRRRNSRHVDDRVGLFGRVGSNRQDEPVAFCSYRNKSSHRIVSELPELELVRDVVLNRPDFLEPFVADRLRAHSLTPARVVRMPSRYPAMTPAQKQKKASSMRVTRSPPQTNPNQKKETSRARRSGGGLRAEAMLDVLGRRWQHLPVEHRPTAGPREVAPFAAVPSSRPILHLRRPRHLH
jgi:hypothetical protein